MIEKENARIDFNIWIPKRRKRFVRIFHPFLELNQLLSTGQFGRIYETIQCPFCGKVTMVDDTILYQYCPHCGERNANY